MIAVRLVRLSHGLEQVAGAVEVHAVSLLEIPLGFAGDDGRKAEYHVRPRRQQQVGCSRDGEIAGFDRDRYPAFHPWG